MPTQRGSNVFSRSMKAIILERDSYTCAYCGAPAAYVDHVNPRSNGGTATLDNGVACCRQCNLFKSAKLDLVILARGFYVALSKQSEGVQAEARPEPKATSNNAKSTKKPHIPLGSRARVTILGHREAPDGAVRGVPKRTVSSEMDGGDHRQGLSRRCRASVSYPLCHCHGCGQDFVPMTTWQRFCGRKCSNDYWREVYQRTRELVLADRSARYG